MDHNAPWLAAPPSQSLLCVLCYVPCFPLLAMHTLTLTLTLALLTMPKQIWRWKMIHHWPCTAVSAPSYRVVGQAKSCFKSLYPYCCKDRASYNWTSPLSVHSWSSSVSFWSESINNFHVQYILLFEKGNQRTLYSLMWEFFYSSSYRDWQSVKPAMKHVSLCLKELLTHLNELNLFRFQLRV